MAVRHFGSATVVFGLRVAFGFFTRMFAQLLLLDPFLVRPSEQYFQRPSGISFFPKSIVTSFEIGLVNFFFPRSILVFPILMLEEIVIVPSPPFSI